MGRIELGIIPDQTPKIIGADPWNRKSHKISNCSTNLSFDLKRAVVRASATVVGIVSSGPDEAKIIRASGFVIESVASAGRFVSTILTTALILRPEPEINALADGIKISVMLPDGSKHKGRILGYDFHYNIGVIKIKTSAPIATATLRHVDDSISIDPNMLDKRPPKIHPQSGKFNLVPGDTVIALGRYHGEHDTYGLMVIAGKYSVWQMLMDCHELLRASCEIPSHGIGGPLINCYGEVIGINCSGDTFTPFLPINIVSLWWERFKRNGHCLLPRLGVKLDNLYMQGLAYLEVLIQRFPNISKGVVIGSIMSEGLASGILPNDIIVECDGKSVGSVLELFELIWDKVGHAVNLCVVRPSECLSWNATMVVGNVAPNQFNRWPLLERPLWLRRRRPVSGKIFCDA